MPKYFARLIIAGLLLPQTGCFNTSTETENNEVIDENAPIVLTEEQKEIAGIELGVIEKRLVDVQVMNHLAISNAGDEFVDLHVGLPRAIVVASAAGEDR